MTAAQRQNRQRRLKLRAVKRLHHRWLWLEAEKRRTLELIRRDAESARLRAAGFRVVVCWTLDELLTIEEEERP